MKRLLRELNLYPHGSGAMRLHPRWVIRYLQMWN